MTKKYSHLIVASLIVSFGLSTKAFAATELKVAVVDMQKALQTVDSGKKARSELEVEFNKKKTELQQEEAAIKKSHEDFQKQSLALSDTARAKKQQELQEKIMKFQEKTQRSQAEIQKREQQLTEPIVQGLKKIIKESAEKKGYTLVLEKNENMVLYSLEKDDLTGEVVSTYNTQKK